MKSAAAASVPGRNRPQLTIRCAKPLVRYTLRGSAYHMYPLLFIIPRNLRRPENSQSTAPTGGNAVSVSGYQAARPIW